MKKILLSILLLLFLFSSCESGKNIVPETELSTATKNVVQDNGIHELKEIELNQADYWPNDNWETCLPEHVGVDSETLYKMVKRIMENKNAIDSILIVRNGYSILDISFTGNKGSIHELQSCTKSFTSALLGMAIKEGYISGVETKVLDYFNDKSIENIDERKKAMTIEHLLSMSAGLEWDGYYTSTSKNDTNQMYINSDPVRYVLNKPMVSEPGRNFVYNTGASQVLSAIIEEVTGVDVKVFADNTLFKDLGITKYYWGKTLSGDYGGGFGLYMSSTDMAKFGYLYLKNGVWNGKQILPENWVETSTSKHVNVTDFDSNGYGYQWWINRFGGYSARGLHGQYIFIMPDEEMVVVFQSSLDGTNEVLPLYYMENYILSSIKSDYSLPDNPEFNNLLHSICTE